MDEKINIICYVDGGFDSKNKKNPYGSMKIFEQDSGRVIHSVERMKLNDSVKTSNESEYAMMIELLKYLYENKSFFEAITVCGDSKIIIKQITGSWCVNAPNLEKYYNEATTLIREIENLIFIWIGRNTIERILGH